MVVKKASVKIRVDSPLNSSSKVSSTIFFV